MKTFFKTLLVSAIFVGAFFSTAQAQFSFGLKGGANFSTIINYDNLKIDVKDNITAPFTSNGDNAYRTGFNAGIFVSFAVADNRLVFQPELIFSQQGMKNTGTATLTGYDNLSYEATVKTDYLTIPMMVQFYFIKRVLYMEIGPQVGFMVNSTADYKIDASVGGLSYHSEDSWDIGDNLNKVDFSFGVGVGFQIPTWPIGINARYTIGVTNVSKDDTDNDGTYNSVFQLGAFLKFGNSGR